jgi:hypothetical protein
VLKRMEQYRELALPHSLLIFPLIAWFHPIFPWLVNALCIKVPIVSSLWGFGPAHDGTAPCIHPKIPNSKRRRSSGQVVCFVISFLVSYHMLRVLSVAEGHWKHDPRTQTPGGILGTMKICPFHICGVFALLQLC